MERLKGKTAMVVGAGSIGPGWGNGKATAVTFAREGAQVFCVDRNAAAAQETVDIITKEGGKAIAFTADVSREAEVEAMVAACVKAYGRIDVLDNNVGIAEMGNVVEVDEASWDHVFAVNLKSAYFAMKRSAAIGQTDEGIAFAIVPFSGILFFAVVFACAIVAMRQPETHKRLMLLAGISILDAAVARWFLTFLAPPGPAGPPPVIVTIPPAFIAYLLLVAAMVFDWRTRGRPHPVYVYGGLALIAVKLLSWPISATPLWHSFAGGILAMAQ